MGVAKLQPKLGYNASTLEHSNLPIMNTATLVQLAVTSLAFTRNDDVSEWVLEMVDGVDFDRIDAVGLLT